MLRLNVMVFAFLAGSYLYAADLSSEFTQSKNAISVLGISSSFKTSEGSISGTGIGVEFSHSFTDRLTLDVSISTALSAQKSVSNSFTGLGGYLYYNLFADCCDKSKTLLVSGVPVLTESTSAPYLLQLGGGINQFFLNGSKGVYSSSGIGLGANFYFRLWNYRIKLMARSAQLTSNQINVQGTFIGAGLIFPL